MVLFAIRRGLNETRPTTNGLQQLARVRAGFWMKPLRREAVSSTSLGWAEFSQGEKVPGAFSHAQAAAERYQN